MRKLVLWGHHVDEYKEMFDLKWSDFDKKILEYGCGPSGINHELNEATPHVVSCDPLFNLDKSTLNTKISLIFDHMQNEVQDAKEYFDFSRYGDLEHLLSKRKQGIETFLADYEQGRVENRYVPVNDYHLSFGDFAFDYALCSHYFFADLDEQDVDFHVKVIKELARVANEVRIFPLIDRYGKPSPQLGPVLLALQNDDYGTEVREVDYNLQQNGNAMLRVWAQKCDVS